MYKQHEESDENLKEKILATLALRKCMENINKTDGSTLKDGCDRLGGCRKYKKVDNFLLEWLNRSSKQFKRVCA